MKDNLRETIKADAHKPQDNHTFVPRVLNRLPRREPCRWILPLAYVLSFAILATYAVMLLNGNGHIADNLTLIGSVALVTYGLLYTILRPVLRSL